MDISSGSGYPAGALLKVMDILDCGNSLEECLKLVEKKWQNQSITAALVGSLADTYYMILGDNLARYVDKSIDDNDTARGLYITHAFLFADHVVKYRHSRTADGSKLFC